MTSIINKKEDTLKYMDSKEYKEIIANAQKEFKDLTNRDIEFFNMGKKCFRGYVLRMIDEYIAELKDGKEWGASIPVITLKALKEQLKR